jgi:hypothetical protein
MNQLPRPHARILRRKRRSKGGDHCAPAIQKGLGGRQIVAHLLRAAGASQCAIAAQDAEFRHDLSTVILNPNRFHWASADALIAILAFVFPGFNEINPFHAAPATTFPTAPEVLATLPP